MSERRLRRWLVPGAAVASIALPLLAGGCFEELSEEWQWLRDCDDCRSCYDEEGNLDPGARLIPEGDLPPLPQDRLGQEPGTGYAQPPEETPTDEMAQGLPGAPSNATPEEEDEPPPTAPFRPRIPEGVLVPRPDPHLPPPTQSPPNY